jgi:hypothetical protein
MLRVNWKESDSTRLVNDGGETNPAKTREETNTTPGDGDDHQAARNARNARNGVNVR